MLDDHQIKTLMLLHDLEEKLGDLYELFSEKFPEHNGLWNILIKEEQFHAEAVRKLYKLTFDGESLFNEGTIKTAAIQTIIDYIIDTSEHTRLNKYSALQALTIAYDLESSLLEKDMFKHFGVSSRFAEMLQFLQDGSENHARLAKAELERLKAGL